MYEFKFPDVGEGITEGEIVSWKVKIGDSIKADQVIAEVETAKAIVEIPSPVSGVVKQLHGKEGDTIEVGNVLITIDDGSGGAVQEAKSEPEEHKEEKKEKKDAGTVIGTLPEYEDEVEEEHHFILKNGEKLKSLADLKKKLDDIDDDTYAHHVNEVKNDFASWVRDVMRNNSLASQIESAKSREELTALLVPKEPETKSEEPKQESKAAPAQSSTKIKAMPGARKLAKEKGIDLTTLTPTGKKGQVTKADVEGTSGSAKTSAKATIKKREFDLYGYIETIPFKGIRKTIAKRMVESQQKTATLTHFDEVDVTNLAAIRKRHKETVKDVKLTFLPYIVKAVIATLKKHPRLNAHADDEKVIIKKYYSIGIAVDTEQGLMVPVVKIADKKSLIDIAKNIEKLAAAAKERKLDMSDLQGGTFTITNAGSVGGLFGTPILNYPEVGILFLGRIVEKPVVVDGEIAIRKILPLSLSYDHRVVDGADAARFVNDLKTILHEPDRLLLE